MKRGREVNQDGIPSDSEASEEDNSSPPACQAHSSSSTSVAESHGSTKATKRGSSCAPCRKRKVKCEPFEPGGPPYPCVRCVRLKLQCADPRLAEGQVDEIYRRNQNLLKVLGKGILQQPETCMDRLKSLLGFYTNIYRRRVLTGLVARESLEAHHYVELMKNILGRFSMELDSYLPSLTPLDGPDTVMLDGYFLTNQAERCKGLHPYVAFLFQSALTTVCFTSIRGVGRFLTDEQFQKQFYTEEEAEKAWNEEGFLPPLLLGSILSPQERPRFEKCIREMIIDARSSSSEQTCVYKVYLRKLGATVMAMVRTRMMLQDKGNYLAIAIAMSPLPMHAAAPRRGPQGDRRAVLHCVMGTDPWVECAKTFGDWGEMTLCLPPPPSDGKTQPLSLDTSSSSSVLQHSALDTKPGDFANHLEEIIQMTTSRPSVTALPMRRPELPLRSTLPHKRQPPPSWPFEPETQRQERPGPRPGAHRHLPFPISNELQSMGGMPPRATGREPSPLGMSLLHDGNGDRRGFGPSQRAAVGAGVVKLERNTSPSSALPDEDLLVLQELFGDELTQSQHHVRTQFGQYPASSHSMELIQAPPTGVQTQWYFPPVVQPVPVNQQHQVGQQYNNNWQYTVDGLGVSSNDDRM